MALTTFTSVQWAQPNGSGLMKKVHFRVIDEAKWTPDFEEKVNALDEKIKNRLEKFRKFNDLLKHVEMDASEEFHVDTEVIDLHQTGLVEIDFAQLQEFPQLRILIMGYNPVLFVDLTPLAKCPHLEQLLLDKCRLIELDLSFAASCPEFNLITLRDDLIDKIDLTPLQHCPQFEVLNMEWNGLKEVDLSPLAVCKKLWFIGLQHNPIKKIDLAPLAQCEGLETLYLFGNEYETLDVRPLANCLKMEDCRVDAGKIIKLPGGQPIINELEGERESPDEETGED